MSGKGGKAGTKGATRTKKPSIPEKIIPEKKNSGRQQKGPGYRILTIGTGDNPFLIPSKNKRGKKS